MKLKISSRALNPHEFTSTAVFQAVIVNEKWLYCTLPTPNSTFKNFIIWKLSLPYSDKLLIQFSQCSQQNCPGFTCIYSRWSSTKNFSLLLSIVNKNGKYLPLFFFVSTKGHNLLGTMFYSSQEALPKLFCHTICCAIVDRRTIGTIWKNIKNVGMACQKRMQTR